MKARTGPVAASDLRPGDIVHEYFTDDDHAVREYAEVRHVEPVVGRNEFLVVFAGGRTATWLDHGDIHLADPDAYEHHQAAIHEQQNRDNTVARLQRLVQIIQAGAPVGRRLEIKLGSMTSADAVRDIAARLGAEVDERDGEWGFNTSLTHEFESGFEVSAWHYRHKGLAEQKAWREKRDAEAAEAAGEPAEVPGGAA